jgi:hypothetical protein
MAVYEWLQNISKLWAIRKALMSRNCIHELHAEHRKKGGNKIIRKKKMIKVSGQITVTEIRKTIEKNQ